jgi:transposase
MVHMPTFEEIAALRQALSDAIARGEELVGELRVVRTERDLLKEQLNRFKRQLFDAKSEVSAHQKDLFFNEAEVEGAQAQPAAEQTEDGKIAVPAHQRTKRGRKPLDPALPREVRRHELPEGERVCPHDGARLSEIGVEVSEQLDVVPQQVRVIRHEQVKYACPCCDGGLRLAAKPAQVIPKGLLSEAALAWVITSKYLDGRRCTARRRCWAASAARSCRATRWPPASCGWARRRSRWSTCCVTNCWTRSLSTATRPRCRCSRNLEEKPRPRATCGCR